MVSPKGIIARSTEEDSETARVILEKLGDVTEVITPTRVLFASIATMVVCIASIFAVLWIIPYDNVDLETVYMQSGSGHVVLVELDNRGSRAIEDVSVTIRFLGQDGSEIDRHDFFMSKLPAHSAISNTPSDDLELVVMGESVWEEYEIHLTLEYSYYGGEKAPRTWVHPVGNWTREAFVDHSQFELF
ncbi:MAG: hypothetical protein CMB78_04125 [Euryarchaeota archaeon]|nr:hypothetical protein [Euryarchaeota archaeon]